MQLVSMLELMSSSPPSSSDGVCSLTSTCCSSSAIAALKAVASTRHRSHVSTLTAAAKGSCFSEQAESKSHTVYENSRSSVAVLAINVMYVALQLKATFNASVCSVRIGSQWLTELSWLSICLSQMTCTPVSVL